MDKASIHEIKCIFGIFPFLHLLILSLLLTFHTFVINIKQIL